MIKLGFIKNELQNAVVEEKRKGNAEKLILDADTGSGKTEAIMLALENAKGGVDWFLPTISSCIFMYRRLCDEFPEVSISVQTSIMKEERVVKGAELSIRICTPDPAMVEYITGAVKDGVYNKTTRPNLVLDELDNYPEMVRTVLAEYINTIPLNQVIVASATLDENLKQVFEEMGFNKISYRRDNCIKFKYGILPLGVYHSLDTFHEILKENLHRRRIVYIANAICNMDTAMWNLQHAGFNEVKFSNTEDSRYIYLHSNLTLAEREIVEKKIYTNDYDILISNDLISFSIDFNAEVGIIELTDSWGVNLQRIGRFNRRNQFVDYTNLYFAVNSYKPGFIDRDEADECEDYFFEKTTNVLTNSDWKELGERVEVKTVDYEEVVNSVKNLIELDLPVKLREVPYSFLVPVTQTVYKGKGKNRKAKEIETFQIVKTGGYFPWATLPCSEPRGMKDLVDLGDIFIIKDFNALKSGNIPVERYDGDGYEDEFSFDKQHQALKDTLVDFGAEISDFDDNTVIVLFKEIDGINDVDILGFKELAAEKFPSVKYEIIFDEEVMGNFFYIKLEERFWEAARFADDVKNNIVMSSREYEVLRNFAFKYSMRPHYKSNRDQTLVWFEVETKWDEELEDYIPQKDKFFRELDYLQKNVLEGFEYGIVDENEEMSPYVTIKVVNQKFKDDIKKLGDRIDLYLTDDTYRDEYESIMMNIK